MMLRTPRLLIRSLLASDQQALHDLNSHDEVQHFLRSAIPSEEEDAASLHRQLAANRLHHDLGHVVAVPAEDPSAPLVGWFHLRPGPDGDIFNPELGWRLHPSVWGQGLATEACRALLEHAFTTVQASSVTAETLAANLASRRVMARLGMAETGMRDWTSPDPVPGREQGVVQARIGLRTWLDTHEDVRSALHELQARALKERDKSALETLRTLGMDLARIETDGVRASQDLVAELARARAISW
ncbi:MAG: GNAT family N-acetyltransferase [Luteococcus japonicus]